MLIAIAALVDVGFVGPPVAVRWRPEVTAAERAALERQFDLRKGEPDEGTATTWEYELGTRSRDNIAALLNHPATEDTHNIDRDALAVPRPTLRVGLRQLPDLPFPFSTTPQFAGPRGFFQLQSGCLLLAGGLMLWAARVASARRRRNVAVATLLTVGALAYAFPISPTDVTMSDAMQHVDTRGRFDQYAAVYAVRFESHLTAAVLAQVDRRLGRTEDSPERAQAIVMRAAAAWLLLCAVVVGVVERWSPGSLRYLALALLAPSALLYFGWREFGYLSLNVAAFPLIARGVRDGGWRLEAGSLLCGLGAAFHGWGLVSLAGAALAAAVAPAAGSERVGRVLRVAAWGTAAYLGWVALYVIVLKLPIVLGHTEAVPWRPWFADRVFDGRLNPAIFSAPGVRDVAMQAWVVGVPLLFVVVSLWREHQDEVRVALSYALPSLAMALLVWHTQGLHEDMDVVFGIFPGLYALAWVCAHDPARTKIAAALLVSAHVAFWRIVLDAQFRSITLG